MRFILDSPRWAFLLLLTITPWAWGGIPVWIELVWSRACLIVVASYLVVGLGRRNLSWPPIVLFLSAAWILTQGWWMATNALYQQVPQLHGFLILKQAHPGWPGSVDRDASLRMMTRVSALLGALYLVYDLSQSYTWRKRLLFTLLLTGASLASFGLIMRLESPSGIWPDIDRNNYPFATFYYHGNAAAYLNTLVPMAIACLLRSLFTSTGPFLMAFWVCATLVLIAAALVCASKAGMVIALGLMIVLAVVFGWLFRGRFDRMTFDLPPLFLWLTILGIAGTLIYFIGQQAIFQRWQFALDAGDAVMAGRRQTAQICLNGISTAGWWGFGPGTFATFFPLLAHQQKVVLGGIWLEAHEDYLQTVLEWGQVGAIAWAVLFFGAMLRPLLDRIYWVEMRRFDRILVVGLILSVLGCAVHALVDYPLQITAIEFNLMVVMGLLWSCPHWQLHSKNRRRRLVPTGEMSPVRDEGG